MAKLYAYSAFNINFLDLNYYARTYQSESLYNNVYNPWEDNYFIYNIYDEALSMGGTGFEAIGAAPPTKGTVEALGDWFRDSSGDWYEYFAVSRLNLPMADLIDAIFTPSNKDDLALVKSQFSGNDRIYLSDFDDSMDGFRGADVMYGNDGRDILDGGKGKDKLFGGRGKDKLKGGDGDDIIRGGRGRDVETGGDGEDTFRFRTGDDKSIITDFDARGSSHDVIDLSGLRSIKNWSDLTNNHMERDGADVVIDGRGGDVITLQDVTLHSLDKGDFLF